MSITATQLRTLMLRLASVWLIAMVLLSGKLAIESVVQNNRQSAYMSQIAAAQQHASFYRVIADQGESVSSSPSVTLAYDLRENLGPIDPTATSLPDDIVHFYGDNNAYGGITGDLGFNPFAGSGAGCSECGPLSASFRASLLLIKQGKVDQVIAHEMPKAYATGDLSVFGLSPLGAVLTLYLFGSPMFLATAWQLTKLSADSRRFKPWSELEWDMDGECDGTKRVIFVLAPTYFLIRAPLARHRLHSTYTADVLEMRRKVTDQLRWLNRQISRIDDPNAQALVSRIHRKADGLMDAHGMVTPNSMMSAATSMNDYLERVKRVITAYIRVQNGEDRGADVVPTLPRYIQALDDFEAALDSSIKQLRSVEDIEIDVALKELAAARHASI